MSTPLRILLGIWVMAAVVGPARPVCAAGDLAAQAQGVPLLLNEILASNSRVNQDPQGQYDDWIELYNAGTVPINAAGLYLTDDWSKPTKWRIPADRPAFTTIPARGYLLIWADGDTASAGLHAGFRLNAGGGRLALFAADGQTLIDAMEYEEQTPNVSYGRDPTAANEWRFFAVPTPGRANVGAYLGAVADLKFSHARGFYAQPLAVEITTTTPGAAIFYTVDDSSPFSTQRGVPTGQLYTGPIPITTTTTLRAIAIKAGWMSTKVATHTYIFPRDVATQATSSFTRAQVIPPGYPASWGSVAGDYQMDPDVVGPNGTDLFNGLYARTIQDDLQAVPTICLVMDKGDWFGSRGIYINKSEDGTERVASFEFMNPSTGQSIQVNCALAMQGGVSGGGTSLQRWKTYKLSMRPRFKPQTDDGTPTGGPSKLDFKLFSDSPVGTHNTVVLDAVLNHSWLHADGSQRDSAIYFQDQYVSDLHNAMGGHSGHGFYAHVYINTLYWGMYYIHERPDHAWAAQVFGGREEEYDALKHNSSSVINHGLGGNATTNYSAMINLANAVSADPTNAVKYQALCNLLDVDDFITYLLANYYCGNHDWPAKNWYATHRNAPGGKWRFHSWDAEHTLEGDNQVSRSPSDLHAKLARNAEYRLRFADHVRRHFFHGGPLTPQGAAGLYKLRMSQVDRAIVGESARWGDNRRSYPYTRQDWLNTQNAKLATFFPTRTNQVLGWLKSANLYPSVDAPEFHVNGEVQHGGHLGSRDTLSVIPAGTIWYTLDGSDPRMAGGGILPTALRYTGPTLLAHSAQVKARTLSGTTWSALSEAVFSVGPVAQGLRVSELMYHPLNTGHPDDPNTEFIELTNIAGQTINLNLVRFTKGIGYTFASFVLPPGGYCLVVKDRAAFEAKYGPTLPVVGQYTGSLDNGGERIEFVDAVGQVIQSFTYSDKWYKSTDGQGFSLTVKDPANSDANSLNEKAAWQPSAQAGGSPGFDERGPGLAPGSAALHALSAEPQDCPIAINEIFPHAHGEASDWIELYNTGTTAVEIGGWFLSDNKNDLLRYQIATPTTIGPGEYLVLYETIHFGNPFDPGTRRPFAFTENGETAYLYSGNDEVYPNVLIAQPFGASETGSSFGRHLTSLGTYAFVTMSEPTPGAANAYPRVGPVVIHEIMYHPPGNADAEYVELLNISGAFLTLFDFTALEPWRLTDDAGVDLRLPIEAPVILSPGEPLLLVRDPNAMRQYHVPAATQVLAWNSGRLSNRGGTLRLLKPGDVDARGTRYWIEVDRVDYSDGAHGQDFPGEIDPWPIHADGFGFSLGRRHPTRYGNDPNNWHAALPTPGSIPTVIPAEAGIQP